MELRWEWKSGEEICAKRLDELHRLRNTIFVVMTGDPWQEVDGSDTAKNCYHLMAVATKTDAVVAYGRLIVPTDKEQPVRFSRIFVVPDYRKNGYFRAIIEGIFDKAIALGFGAYPMRIHATLTPQTEKVYRDFGFETVGNVDKVGNGILLQDKTLKHIAQAFVHYQENKTRQHFTVQMGIFAQAKSLITVHQSDSLNVCQAAK